MSDISITPALVVAGTGAATKHGTAGATITAGQVVARDATTGKYILADNNSATEAVREPRGIALNGASLNQPLAVLIEGPLTIGGTLTANVAYYLSDTPGGICPVADLASGEYPTLLGMAISATVLDVGIQQGAGAL